MSAGTEGNTEGNIVIATCTRRNAITCVFPVQRLAL